MVIFQSRKYANHHFAYNVDNFASLVSTQKRKPEIEIDVKNKGES